jgi:hypothetical protein
MDDFNIQNLYESKNEWGARLLNLLMPQIFTGFKSIFIEACNLCNENNEMKKYLMTFQNYITRIPNWNNDIIQTETTRICNNENCQYLEDLLTCVHIIQLKIMTNARVGQTAKRVNINIPKINNFIHKVYILVARKIYKNIYLYEINIPPLQIQKNNREIELIINECILMAIRESIPLHSLLKSYLDETCEEVITEEIHNEIIEEPNTSTGGNTDNNDNDMLITDKFDTPIVKDETNTTEESKTNDERVDSGSTEPIDNISCTKPIEIQKNNIEIVKLSDDVFTNLNNTPETDKIIKNEMVSKSNGMIETDKIIKTDDTPSLPPLVISNIETSLYDNNTTKSDSPKSIDKPLDVLEINYDKPSNNIIKINRDIENDETESVISLGKQKLNNYDDDDDIPVFNDDFNINITPLSMDL